MKLICQAILRTFLITISVVLLSALAFAQTKPVAGLHLMTYQSWGFTVDSSAQGERVRSILNSAKELGFKSVILNFRAHMITGVSSDIRPVVPVKEQAIEEKLVLQTVDYAKSLGLSVSFRPILLVVGPKGEFPYIEKKNIYWWHGNIQPKNPDAWFASYYKYHERYLKLAAKAGADMYSIGAEMNSMTSGLGDREPTWRLGYPAKWVEMIRKAREILGAETKITYGINYTDQYVQVGGQKIVGGEIEQWKFYLTETFEKPANQKHQKDLQELWNSLDVVGFDYYRALASSHEKFSTDYSTLLRQLEARPQSHASQLDTVLTEIALTLGAEKPAYIQEVGYASVENCFLEPAAYESSKGKLNLAHQSAAWESFLKAFWEPQWPWMSGFGMWQVLVDENTTENDKGFTPLHKKSMHDVLKKYLN
ncbi:hypothetical protein [Bdellovibrio sp. KM01]|uniref:glycoside hydrolase family 113 n=1 Tax=Bdellovibrio sp. KM01 TaxID=2748865 RepID=UPI0015EAFAE0|nr:hypothetical protein [Bdellovibrio sp. KM01]QLY26372.1 hypothetical protein HW988_04915 [Bdellovibrio sp. KM01]